MATINLPLNLFKFSKSVEIYQKLASFGQTIILNYFRLLLIQVKKH